MIFRTIITKSNPTVLFASAVPPFCFRGQSRPVLASATRESYSTSLRELRRSSWHSTPRHSQNASADWALPHSRSTILEIANFSPQLRDGDLLLCEMILGLRFRAGAHLQAHVREWLAWPSSTSFLEISIPLNPEICLQSCAGRSAGYQGSREGFSGFVNLNP